MTAKDLVPYLPQQPAPKNYEPCRRYFGEHDRIGVGFDLGDGDGDSGVYYKCISTFGAGHVFERVYQPGFTETFTNARIAEFENGPGWRYDPDYFAKETAEARMKAGDLRFEDLHHNRQKRIVYKHAICDLLRPLLETRKASLCDDGLQRGLDIIFETHGAALDKLNGVKLSDGSGFDRWIPCVKSVRSWLNVYKNANFNALALVDAFQYGPQPSPLSLDIQDILFEISLKYASTDRPTKKDVHRQLETKINKVNKEREAAKLDPFDCPSYNKLSECIDANGAFFNYAGRWNADKAKQHFVLVMGGVRAIRIGQRWEMDSWTAHLRTWLKFSKLWQLLSPDQKTEIEKGRWTLCAVLDCASEAVLGMRLSATENFNSAVATLEMGMMDKTAFAASAGAVSTWHMYSGCGTLATDQGPAFIAYEFRQACIDAGIKFDNPPAATPYLRGKIERLFRTIDLQAFCRLAGRTFENVVARGDEEIDLTCLTIEQLATVLVLYVVDCYHQEGHEGLGGETPRNAYDNLYEKRGAAPPPDKRTRRNAFGIKITRKISKKGVRVLNLFYNNRVLNKYMRHVGEGAEVDVIVDRHDLGWISVRIGEKGFASIPCIIPEMQGVNIIVWAAVCEDLRRRFKTKNIPSHAIALDALDRIAMIGDAARLAYSIASPIITRETVDRLERLVEIPWKSREAARANPNAGGDFLANAIPSNPTGDFHPPADIPANRPAAPKPKTAPQDWEEVNPDTGEISPTPPDPDDDGDAELPDGWTIED
ncbi:Mu transposase C-terminal domain-containing protein [uncultured Rhodoblastus sp.]|uniref:Mu transposase C-terminal domain-containing protein n=1 Tax=uncultured Rhodoblastus sp. TaxID=543037 RepID=UPI0025E6B8F3|nr:Mu transposase C-terminal domain-containing protein [uncultured Rhodoblastus sp.]